MTEKRQKNNGSRVEQGLYEAWERIRELEALDGEFRRTEAALMESEATYRALFENSPVALWEEDFSGVRKILDGLREDGVADFEAYLREHPETVALCAQQIIIKDVNRATVELYEAADKEELLGSLEQLMVPESMELFIAELVTLAQGSATFEGEIENITLKGQSKLISIILRLAPGHEKIWDRVYVSIMDITEKRRMETERLQRQKLLGVLETAGAASHDLNQPLQTIVGQLELLLLSLDRAEDQDGDGKGPDEHPNLDQIRERVEKVLEEVDRMIEITRSLSRITSAESTDYVAGERILDLEKSSEG